MLVKLLDGVAFILGLIGIASVEGAIYSGTSFWIPAACLISAAAAYHLARRENGDLRKGSTWTRK